MANEWAVERAIRWGLADTIDVPRETIVDVVYVELDSDVFGEGLAIFVYRTDRDRTEYPALSGEELEALLHNVATLAFEEGKKSVAYRPTGLG